MKLIKGLFASMILCILIFISIPSPEYYSIWYTSEDTVGRVVTGESLYTVTDEPYSKKELREMIIEELLTANINISVSKLKITRIKQLSKREYLLLKEKLEK